MVEINRHIEIEGGYNVRDLGGYPTADGRVTRSHVLVRAGTLDKLTPRGQRQLADYGVRTIVDLRDETEAREYPDLFVPSTTYLNLPYFGDTLTADETWSIHWSDTPTLHGLYHHYFDRCQQQVKAIISAVTENEPGILFHCYAGKDRTGLTAAFLLSSVGVPVDVIAEDYERTSLHIQHLIAEWRESAQKTGGDLRLVERDGGSSAETMFAALDYLEQRYGGVASYLNRCGITEQQIARLKALLVE
ncbi:MAG: tyrosine-protein phosphatase [Chloroflexota bacterium]